jgi:hypothetical protein
MLHMLQDNMSKYSFVKYLLYDLKKSARYPPSIKYEDDKQVRKSKEEYSSELDNLKDAHPRVNSLDIEKGIHTHTLMTGGKFLFNDEPIPTAVVFPKHFFDLHRSFRDAAPRLLGRKETYEDMIWLILKHTSTNKKAWDADACLTEAVSKPYHRFFLDLDLLFAQEHESVAAWNIFVRKLCLSVGKAVLACYPEIATTQDPRGQFEFSVLCTKGYRPKVLGENVTVYKRGIHMVWPGLVVTQEMSECLARSVDEYLTKDVPRDLQRGENTWKDAIDISVYKSGLRPVGCAKITPCSKCRPIARKKVPVGMSYEYSARYCDYKMCHPPTGFISQGEESVYSLDFISRADGVVFSKPNFRLRMDSHVLKDEMTGKEFDFSFKNLTSIRSSATEATAGFLPPSHLRVPINVKTTDYNIDVKQDPESGDYLPPSKRKKTNPRNSHALLLSIPQLETMTRILQGFHVKYKNVIIDRVWAFCADDPKKLLPPREGEAPKRTLYDRMWFVVKGDGSHYCFNKPGVHASSTIRFEVDYHGNVYQNCWCSKTYNGKPCSKQSTKGKAGFIDKVVPSDYAIFVDIFTTKPPSHG